MALNTLRCVLGLALIVAFAGSAHAQDYSVPSGWRQPSINGSSHDRAVVAQAGLEQMINIYDSQTAGFGDMMYWDIPEVFNGMALKDYAANTTDNRFVTNALQTAASLSPGFTAVATLINVPIYYGLSAMYAYRAYNDSSMLQIAEDVWNSTMVYTMTDADAQSGSHPTKVAKFPGTCNGATLAGGVFYSSANDSLDLNTITTGYFLILSAHLAEITSQKQYSDAALLSAQFMVSHLIQADTSLVIDHITAGTCAPSTGLATFATGTVIEGFAVLANVTGDSQWETLMLASLTAAAHASEWQGSDGIIIEGSDTSSSANADASASKGQYMRSLYEPWIRFPNNGPLQTLIQSYVAVQYNALTQLASTTGSNFYSANWHGPAAANYTDGGMLAALGLLAVAIGPPLVPTPTGSTSAPSGTGSGSSSPAATSKSPTPGPHSDIGLIIGVVIGVIGAILSGLAAAFFLRRRLRSRRRYNIDLIPPEKDDDTGANNGSGSLEDTDPSLVAIPFSYPTSASASSAALLDDGSRARVPPSGLSTHPYSPTSTSDPWGSASALPRSSPISSYPPSAAAPGSNAANASGSGTPQASTVSARDEKRALRQEQERLRLVNTETGPTTPGGELGRDDYVVVPAPGNPAAPAPSATPYEDLPTPELVRILAQRLATGQGHPPEDNLPVYEA